MAMRLIFKTFQCNSQFINSPLQNPCYFEGGGGLPNLELEHHVIIIIIDFFRIVDYAFSQKLKTLATVINVKFQLFVKLTDFIAFLENASEY